MLTNHKMYYAEDASHDDEDVDEYDSSERMSLISSRGVGGSNVTNSPGGPVPSSRSGISPAASSPVGGPSPGPTVSEELHFGEKWFHGKIERVAAQQLLNRYSYLGDGTFLVRESETFVGDYTLSFWRQGKVNHCRIKSKHEQNQKKYYLMDKVLFDSLYGLISHYQTYPLITQEFRVCLKEPVPQQNDHENEKWYHKDVNRTQAEDMLKRIRYDGAFLVRPSEQEENCFSISFRAEGMIKHCRIKHEGRLFVIASASFESLTQLIKWYEKNPLYRKTKLIYPVNENVLRTLGSPPEYTCLGDQGNNYIDSASFPSGTSSPIKTITVKAICDYIASRDDELSFPKHAIITDVIKNHEGWWTGTYGGRVKKWFPANFVTENLDGIFLDETDSVAGGDSMPLGNLQKGAIDIINCSVATSSNRSRPYTFKIISPTQTAPIEISAQSEEDLVDWITKIKETSASANEMIKKGKKIERDLKIAKEFSSLIIYCRAVPFTNEGSYLTFFVSISILDTHNFVLIIQFSLI